MRAIGDPIAPSRLELVPGIAERTPEAFARVAPYMDDLLGPEVDIASRVEALAGGDTDFSGRKAAVVAHWDPDGLIDPYVEHYLRHLRGLGYLTILATGSEPVKRPESPWLSALVLRRCPGYDFTSWKAAFARFPSLYLADEVVLANDSVFAPFGSFAPVHAAMAAVECDFWGLCESWQMLPHLQSYYLVLRRGTLDSDALRFFWSKVRAAADRDYAVRLEIAFAAWLAMHGLAAGAFIPAAELPIQVVSPIHLYWRQLIQRHGVPVLKRNILSGECEGVNSLGWEKLAEEKGYPPQLINNYMARNTLARKPGRQGFEKS